MPLLRKPASLHWTFHSRDKMRQYHLSEARIRRVLHSPARVEEGIAPKTTAFMQKTGSEKHPQELWVMVLDAGQVRKVISAWRYPGVTKPRSPIALEFIRLEYAGYAAKEDRKTRIQEAVKKAKWSKWPKRPLGRGSNPKGLSARKKAIA